MSIENDAIIEKVWQDLGGQLSREQVRRTVTAITLEYRDAAVQAFVPIFIHRQAVEALKKQLNGNGTQVNGRVPIAHNRQQANDPAAETTIHL